MSGEICTDNRFEIIASYKKVLVESTNIETSPDEMAVIDNVLFRFWQMGWLNPHKTNADRTGDLLKFAKWVAKEVCIPDDEWENNFWAFQEIACRMLVKLGIMEENDGIYSLKQEAEI